MIPCSARQPRRLNVILYKWASRTGGVQIPRESGLGQPGWTPNLPFGYSEWSHLRILQLCILTPNTR